MVSLAKEGVLSRSKIADLTQALQKARSRIFDLQSSWEQLYEQTREFRQAMKLAPQRVKEVFKEIFMRDKEERKRVREEREARRQMHRRRPIDRDERER